MLPGLVFIISCRLRRFVLVFLAKGSSEVRCILDLDGPASGAEGIESSEAYREESTSDSPSYMMSVTVRFASSSRSLPILAVEHFDEQVDDRRNQNNACSRLRHLPSRISAPAYLRNRPICFRYFRH